ncbi:MAG: endo-1,4-beta-xylanase [Fibrobacterota bacterium]
MRTSDPLARTAKLLLATMVLSGTAQAQLAKGQCKFLGNIITNGVPGDYITYWNQASPENSGKWSSIQSSVKSTSYNWSGFDVVSNWGKQTGNPVKFHTLVWGGQQPGDAGSATLADIQRWFEAVHTRYPNVEQIDVVNEAYPSHAPAPYRGVLKTAAAANGIPAGDYDWIFQAFKMARKLWPDSTKTKLIYNDYNTIEYNNEVTWQVNLAKAAKAQNIPIDGIGLQAHDAWKVSTATVKANIDKIAAVGIPLYVTEYDIGQKGTNTTPTAADDAEQLRVMKEQMTMFWNHPRIKGVTYWGLNVGQTWRVGTGIKYSNGSLRPSMQWLKDWIPANKGVCETAGIETSLGAQNLSVHPGLVVRNIDGRLITGVERNGSFVAVTALGRN